MDATLKTGLQGASPTTFTAVRFDLPGDPGATVRLCSGGIVSFDSQAFASLDATWGALDRVEVISDGVETSRTTARMSFLIPDDDALASLANPTSQGAPVDVWQGAVDRATGAAFGSTAESLFGGAIDTVSLFLDDTTRQATITCTTRAEYQQHVGDALKLTNAVHQSLWAGELGVEYSGDPRRAFWRAQSPRGVISGGGGGGIGGGGSFDLHSAMARI